MARTETINASSTYQSQPEHLTQEGLCKMIAQIESDLLYWEQQQRTYANADSSQPAAIGTSLATNLMVKRKQMELKTLRLLGGA